MNAPAAPQAAPYGGLTPFALSHADVLRHLARHPAATHLEIAEATGRDPSNVRRDLAKLVSVGVVDTGRILTSAGELIVQSLERLDEPEAGAVKVEEPGADAEAEPPELVRIAHHHLRPNPLQPRTAASLGDLSGLADSIEAAEDVLQNLLVFPADADGVHVIAAGERRWRAVGLLIEDGRWPADRGLPCVLREHDEAQADFVALVENGQRQNLSMVEQARAYLRLVEAQGWSAREAARRTGRDPRTVQEMLKVLREADPDMIRWCEEGRLTWEELRGLVRTPKTPEPTPQAEPEQRDIEEIAGPAPTWEEQRRTRIFAGCEALSPKALMVLVETVDKACRAPAAYGGTGNVSCIVGDDREFRREAQDLVSTVGFGFAFLSGAPPVASASDVSVDWLIDKGLHTAHGDREAILRRVRMAAVGEEKTWAAEHHGRYVTPWLNVEEAPAATERPGLTGDAFSQQLHAAIAEEDEADEDDGDDGEAASVIARVAGLVEDWSGPTLYRFPPMSPSFPQEADFAHLLAALGFQAPFSAGEGEEAAGLVLDADGDALCTVDQDRQLPDLEARALAQLVAIALNVCAGAGRRGVRP